MRVTQALVPVECSIRIFFQKFKGNSTIGLRCHKYATLNWALEEKPSGVSHRSFLQSFRSVLQPAEARKKRRFAHRSATPVVKISGVQTTARLSSCTATSLKVGGSLR